VVLGGLQKNSLIDYPGKLSCVCFFQGCNFECPYCHNPELVEERSSNRFSLEEKELYLFLERRKGFLDGVVISGGEPTLQKGLPKFCRTIKRMGYSVKLDTNGSRPLVIKELIEEGLVDYVAMDIKTSPNLYKMFPRNRCKVDDIFSSIGIIMGSKIAYEFRTTCVRPLVDALAVEKIAKNIRDAELYALQGFHRTKLLRPEFFRGIEPAYDQDTMMGLKSIAGSYVQKCILR